MKVYRNGNQPQPRRDETEAATNRRRAALPTYLVPLATAKVPAAEILKTGSFGPLQAARRFTRRIKPAAGLQARFPPAEPARSR